MLDINLFREERGGNPEIVRESQRRRFKDVGLVDRVLELDAKWREARGQLDTLNMDFNKLNKEIGALRKAKQDATALQERSKEMKARIKAQEELEKSLSEERDAAIVPIGNLVPDSVPVDNDEARDNNAVVKEFGERRQEEGLLNHVDLVLLLDIADLEAGAAKPVMAECAQLSQFDEELYKVTGEGEEKYLIATSEQTLCAMHRRDWFDKQQLPIKYIGYSTCFRKEAGSHGRDTLGIFRVHQFEKVEQFVIASPHDDDSWVALEEMIANAEAFYQALGFPYRVVNIVSGALNDAAAKKYDLEAWFPASRAYRELVSCSNCTDYQARRLDIRLRSAKGPGGESKKEYVHMLNGTLSATERTLCCLLENYQTADGVRVPEALQPFMMGIDFIPFKKAFDGKGKLVDRPAAKAAAAADGGAAMSTS
ncbi:hypothetical protein CHLNCDRAFT_56101 [Chlorella variabilis]|uniref:serine--tRNA ligase n=1 Tax=Chlorella variabilis TaxID=554065 RepID=E1ZAA4_CHLVA|nr:hypothetical protein CHLNCDRAFT_56101 [Chlorella variabilis]EFN57228.1 hypothetical protein CHLNCDRAFT_56101 [Chlorella variabilis]|eukprot:XP_005849330.1 hypothetical protein CHLNCDRAFT_56101 [Chlorella variabilis]